MRYAAGVMAVLAIGCGVQTYGDAICDCPDETLTACYAVCDGDGRASVCMADDGTFVCPAAGGSVCDAQGAPARCMPTDDGRESRRVCVDYEELRAAGLPCGSDD